MTTELNIDLGQQTYSNIGAQPGTLGARVLELLLEIDEDDARTHPSMRYPFTIEEDWKIDHHGIKRAKILVTPNDGRGSTRHCTLYVAKFSDLREKVGIQPKEMFCIREGVVSGYAAARDDEFVINRSHPSITVNRLRHFGRQIIAAVVGHGENWCTCTGEVMPSPFGVAVRK